MLLEAAGGGHRAAGAREVDATDRGNNPPQRWFTGPYRRLVLDGVGHFPPREAPEAVAAALTSHLVEAFGL